MNSLTSISAAISNATADREAPQSLVSKESMLQMKEQKVRTAFQTFVAGTFYKQMFKSLRKMTKPPAYFHGGQAEEMFRSQMDQEVSENLAKRQGDALSGPMYHAFAQRLRIAQAAAKPVSQGMRG